MISLLPHTIFNLNSKRIEMVFGNVFLVPFGKSDIITGHVITKLGVGFRLMRCSYFLSKFG